MKVWSFNCTLIFLSNVEQISVLGGEDNAGISGGNEGEVAGFDSADNPADYCDHDKDANDADDDNDGDYGDDEDDESSHVHHGCDKDGPYYSDPK